jgi:mannose/fructose-specific phosphotransferase system component IIA
MLFGGVFFTVASVAAWRMGRRAGGMFLAVLAGVNLALAIELLMRFYKK